jgi:hypothetical protein
LKTCLKPLFFVPSYPPLYLQAMNSQYNTYLIYTVVT